MKTSIAIVLAMALVGCAEGRIREDYQNAKRRAAQRSASLLILDSEPWVYEEMAEPSAIAEFKAELCGGKMDQKCRQKLRKTLVMRMAEKYTYVDGKKVADWCDAHPIECKKDKLLEAKMRESHNETVEGASQESVNMLNGAMDREIAEERQRTAQALYEAGQAFKKNQPKSSTTNCRRDAMGGFTCDSTQY